MANKDNYLIIYRLKGRAGEKWIGPLPAEDAMPRWIMLRAQANVSSAELGFIPEFGS